MNRFHQSPGRPYKAIIDGLWPQLNDQDPRQHPWDVAYREVSSHTMAQRDPVAGTLQFIPTGDPDPLRAPGTRALLRVTCMPRLHNRATAPMLAELWQTSLGLLFLARLPGHLLVPGESGGDPFDPPAAVRNWRYTDSPAVSPTTTSDEWQHVPITIVRVLLSDDVPANLWVGCVRHGPSEVDRVKLYRAYERHMSSKKADTPEPSYVRLNSVAALSSP